MGSTTASFKCQQFEVQQTVSGMKVSADALLFGAWVSLPEVPDDLGSQLKVLDIGTGTGLLSLMVAQRLAKQMTDSCPEPFDRSSQTSCHWHIDAIEIDGDTAQEAESNFRASPWSDHLQVHGINALDLLKQADRWQQQYSLVVCNPPFFEQHTPTSVSDMETSRRLTARHTTQLSYEGLVNVAAFTLEERGQLVLLVPLSVWRQLAEVGKQYGLQLQQVLPIQNTPDAIAKVCALTFVRVPSPTSIVVNEGDYQAIEQDPLVRFSDEGSHTPQTRALLSPYLLRYG